MSHIAFAWLKCGSGGVEPVEGNFTASQQSGKGRALSQGTQQCQEEPLFYYYFQSGSIVLSYIKNIL